MSLKIDST